MKNTGSKRIWTTTTRKAEKEDKDRLLSKFLWLVAVVISLAVTFATVSFPVLKTLPSLMAVFIIIGTVMTMTCIRFTNQGIKFWGFLSNARLEMRKVIWPTKRETVNLTAIVLAIVFVSSLFVYFVGFLFTHLVRWILS